jgi:hypothetical protein
VVRLEVCLLAEAVHAFLELLHDIAVEVMGVQDDQGCRLAQVGGLLFAIPTTLLGVPYLFALLRKGNDGKPAHGVFAEDPQ